MNAMHRKSNIVNTENARAVSERQQPVRNRSLVLRGR